MPDMSTALVQSDEEPPSVRAQLWFMSKVWIISAAIMYALGLI